MATATKGKKKRVGAVIVDGLASLAKQLEQVPKLSPDERLVLTAECENQWHWCKDRKYRTTIKGLVDTGLMRFAKHPQGDNVTGWEVTGLGRAVAAGLRARRPEATIGTHSPSRSKDLAPRENREPDVTRYSGRVAARVRALRIAKGMSVDELRLALERHGVVLVNSALYAYENGNRQINPDHYPALAKVLGVKSVREFLPGK